MRILEKVWFVCLIISALGWIGLVVHSYILLGSMEKSVKEAVRLLNEWKELHTKK